MWRARDLQTDEELALKLFRAERLDRDRLEREIAALRRLDLPGVVRLKDWGLDGETAWLSMELVRGSPFPGVAVPVEWSGLAPLAAGLLQRIDRMHAAGVLHRDLKPANLLVDDAGLVTVLDLGLARMTGALSTVTVSGALMGTPRYMSPEACRGRRLDERSDLYSVGVILYEALTGQIPHDDDEMMRIFHLRATTPAPPIGGRLPNLPAHVASTIDALLERDPSARPPSAAAALRRLQATGQRRGPTRWRGSEDALEAATMRIVSGRSVVVSGPRGSGRSRWVTEVVDRLRARGWRALLLPPAKRPFESLAFALGRPNGEDIVEALERRLAEMAYEVLVADDLPAIDRWSRRFLLDHKPGLPLVASDIEGGDVAIVPLARSEICAMFEGPERFFHLPSDAADTLLRRTGGLPGAVIRELDRWAAAGLARWHGDQVLVERIDLERIGASGVPGGPGPAERVGDEVLDELLLWLSCGGAHVDVAQLAVARGESVFELRLQLTALSELGRVVMGPERCELVGAPLVADDPDHVAAIHAGLAKVLPAGTPGRVAHLLAAGETAAALLEVGTGASALIREGRSAAAVALIEAVTEFVSPPLRASNELGVALANATWSDRTPEIQRRTLTVCERLGLGDPLGQLLASHSSASSEPLEAFADPRLETFRRDLVVADARRTSSTAWAEAVAEGVRWAESTDLPQAHARAWGWRAELAYASGRLADASRAAEQAARVAPAVGDVLAYLFRAASVRLEEGDVAAVAALAAELRDRAASSRLPLHEARGELLLRILAERTGKANEVDELLVEASRAIDEPMLRGNLLLAEARIAWRLQDLGRARALAREAAALWVGPSASAPRVCAEALAIASGGEEDPAGVLATAIALDRPDVLIEVLGLLAHAGRLQIGDWEPVVERAAARLPGYRRDWPHGALSIEGALELIRRNQGRNNDEG